MRVHSVINELKCTLVTKDSGNEWKWVGKWFTFTNRLISYGGKTIFQPYLNIWIWFLIYIFLNFGMNFQYQWTWRDIKALHKTHTIPTRNTHNPYTKHTQSLHKTHTIPTQNTHNPYTKHTQPLHETHTTPTPGSLPANTQNTQKPHYSLINISFWEHTIHTELTQNSYTTHTQLTQKPHKYFANLHDSHRRHTQTLHKQSTLASCVHTVGSENPTRFTQKTYTKPTEEG